MTDSKEWCDGDWRCRSSSKPFAGAESGSPGRALEAGKRGSPGRPVQGEKVNLRVSSVVSPHSFNRSSYVRSLSPGMSLVALLCIFSSISTSFLRYGFHACIQYCK